MSDKQMTLSLRIRANLAEANKHLKVFASTIEGIGRGGARSFTAMNGVLGAALKPMKALLGVAGILSAGVAGLGIAALKAAGDYEALKLRLESVLGSAEAAGKAFRDTMKFANETPFEAGDLIDARILLEGIGVRGVKALKSTAQAAAAMGVGVRDAASMVASLETEPLRRLGISVKRDGESAVFSFRDKMGKLHTIAAKTGEAARASLLRIFDMKFGGATDRLAGSLGGLVSTLKDSFTAAFASFGDGLMPGAKQFISFLSTEIGNLVDSGKLAEMGKKAGEWLTKAATYLQAVIQELPNLATAIGNAFKRGPEVMKELLIAAADAFGSVLISAVVESIKAASGVFIGIGKVIAAAFMEDALRVIPGTGGLRGNLAADAARDDASALGKVIEQFGLKRNAQGIYDAREFPAEAQYALIRSMRENMMQRGVADAMGAVPAASARLAGVARDKFGALNDALAGGTGYNFASAVRARAGAISTAPAQSVYSIGFRRQVGRDNTGPIYDTQYQNVVGAPGKGKPGDVLGGRAVIIQVQKLDVHATDVRALQNRLIEFAGRQFTPAGT